MHSENKKRPSGKEGSFEVFFEPLLMNLDTHPVFPSLDRRKNPQKAIFKLGLCFPRFHFMGKLEAAGIFSIISPWG